MVLLPNSVSLIGPLIAASIVGIAAIVLYRLFFHPLANFPGPKLASVSRLYEAYYDVVLDGQYEFKIRDLHKIYGPIIRISPHELHIDDSSFFNELYRQDGRWDKYDFSTYAQGIPGAAVFTPDHDTHKRRRAPINPFLSKPAVTKRMDLVHAKTHLFQSKIAEFADNPRRGAFDLGGALSAMTMDIATTYVMGHSYNSLEQPDFNAGMTRVLQAAGALWRIAKHVPFLVHVVRYMPLDLVNQLGNESTRAFLDFMKASENRTKEIIASHHAGKRDLSVDSPTLVDQILSASALPPSEKEFLRVNDECSTVTGAGFETTAQVLRQTTYQIYASTSILARLRAELKSLSPTNEWTSTQLMQLPYLTAVLKEGLRKVPGLATRMARLTDVPIQYTDSRTGRVWTIPARTPVGMTTIFMHMDAEIYPEPESFKPERWLDGDENDRRHLERHFAPFSRGTRMCLGIHLAWAELYLTIAMLVSQFDFEFTGGTGPEDIEWGSDKFIMGVKGTNGIKVNVSKYTNN